MTTGQACSRCARAWPHPLLYTLEAPTRGLCPWCAWSLPTADDPRAVPPVPDVPAVLTQPAFQWEA